MSGLPVVYRAHDASGRVLYIGSTTNLRQRLGNHRSQSWWFSVTERFTTEIHEDLAAAQAAEAAAILAERPVANLQHSGSYEDSSRLTDEDCRVIREWSATSLSRRIHVPRALRLRALAT
jgi:predicted GIY-YIG superfamily endonuclease